MAAAALTWTRARGVLGGWRRQLALFAGAYLLYALGRYLTIGEYKTAVGHADLIVDAERWLGIAVERPVQQAMQGTVWLWVLNHLYLAAQLVAVPAALVWLYRRAPRGYGRLRNVILWTWLISVPVYALFPVAPPRLADPGMVDTITTQTGFALDSKLTTALYNPIAAVPSLHAGFALAVGWPSSTGPGRFGCGRSRHRGRWRSASRSWPPEIISCWTSSPACSRRSRDSRSPLGSSACARVGLTTRRPNGRTPGGSCRLDRRPDRPQVRDTAACAGRGARRPALRTTSSADGRGSLANRLARRKVSTANTRR